MATILLNFFLVKDFSGGFFVVFFDSGGCFVLFRRFITSHN